MRSKRWLLFVSLLALSTLPAARASAGTVEGTVWMSRKAQTAAAKDSDEARRVQSQHGVTDVVVWIEKIPEKVELKLAGKGPRWFWSRAKSEPVPSLVQADRKFRPRVMAVPAGGKIEIRNADRVYHSTFSVSAAKRFDLGIHAPGRRDTVQFRRRGVINLHSALYPEMFGFVVVTPNHAYARPDPLGRFSLPKLPPGRYKMRAWHPQRGELVRSVEVPRKGDATVNLRF